MSKTVLDDYDLMKPKPKDHPVKCVTHVWPMLRTDGQTRLTFVDDSGNESTKATAEALDAVLDDNDKEVERLRSEVRRIKLQSSLVKALRKFLWGEPPISNKKLRRITGVRYEDRRTVFLGPGGERSTQATKKAIQEHAEDLLHEAESNEHFAEELLESIGKSVEDVL